MDIHHLEIVTKLWELRVSVLEDVGRIHKKRGLVEKSEFAGLSWLARIECWKKEETVLVDVANAIDEVLKKLGVTFS